MIGATIDHKQHSEFGVAIVMTWLDKLPWWGVIAVAFGLGFAPLFPEPHIWQKLKMLGAGTLSKPLDVFDLALHSAPWLVAGAKLMRQLSS